MMLSRSRSAGNFAGSRIGASEPAAVAAAALRNRLRFIVLMRSSLLPSRASVSLRTLAPLSFCAQLRNTHGETRSRFGQARPFGFLFWVRRVGYYCQQLCVD